MIAVLRQEWYGVQRRTIVMKLSLQPAVLAGKDEIPVTARAAVVSPVRDRRVVPQDRIQSDVGFGAVTEVFRPVVDFFLPGRVPGHFASEWIGVRSPAFGASTHFGFEVYGFVVHALAPEVAKNLQK